MSVDHFSHQFREHVHDILRVGKIKKDTATFDDKITNQVEQNPRPWGMFSSQIT
jgi:hypothetical protein